MQSRSAWHVAARAASFFRDMNQESTCATKGGSLGGFTGSCPACGYPDLEEISPERLHLLRGSNACAGFPLPDGRLPVHCAGRVFVMTQDAWNAFKALCASREAMLAGLQEVPA